MPLDDVTIKKKFTISPKSEKFIVDIVKTKKDSGSCVVNVKEGAIAVYGFVIFSKYDITKNITINLAKNARARILGAVLGSGGQKISLTAVMRHKGVRAKGDIKVHIVGRENANICFRGMIKIDKPAQLANSFLKARALMLGGNARCEGAPELEIEADDVKASHSFSLGRIDKEQIFYLCSRGISTKEAENLIVQGFLNEIFAELAGSEKFNWKEIKFFKNG